MHVNTCACMYLPGVVSHLLRAGVPPGSSHPDRDGVIKPTSPSQTVNIRTCTRV